MSTITREFSKEQLIAAACSRIDFAKQMLRGNPLPLAKRKWEIELSLSEVALASLEAEESGRNPVLAYADSYRDMAKQGVESIPVWSVITDLERNLAPLFAAPPAPVSVPDGYRLQPISEYDAMCAAMLQGAEQQQNSQQNIPEIIPFEQWLSQQTGTIDVECGCVMTEVFFHWLRVAYEAGNSPVIPDDVRRMDWLVSKTVDVREPMVYGSHSLFWSQAITDEEDEYHATKLREQIDAAMEAEQAAAPQQEAQ
ncbi:hypothetical protein OGP25_003416 [Enterobacter hormaechei]